MAKKYKMTGCARFLIFFLVLAPAVYFTVTYLRGENPVEPIKNAIPESWGKKKSNGGTVSDDALFEGQIKTLKNRVDELEEKNADLEEMIEARDQEIRRLKNQ